MRICSPQWSLQTACFVWFLIKFKQNQRGQYMNKNNCLNSWKFRLNQGYTCKLAELELNSKSHLIKETRYFIKIHSSSSRSKFKLIKGTELLKLPLMVKSALSPFIKTVRTIFKWIKRAKCKAVIQIKYKSACLHYMHCYEVLLQKQWNSGILSCVTI